MLMPCLVQATSDKLAKGGVKLPRIKERRHKLTEEDDVTLTALCNYTGNEVRL